MKTNVKDGEWFIGFKECYKTKNGIKIYVDAESISKLTINGSGDFIGKNEFKSDKLEVQVRGSGDIKATVNVTELSAKVHGSGDITVKGSASNQTISVHGSGDYEAIDLVSNSANASVNGSGDIEIQVSESLKARVNGSGDIVYYGNPSNVDSNVNGSGDITRK